METMNDLISRQAAICTIEEYADRLQMVDWNKNPGVMYKAYALNWCINTIRDLPSAQPKVIRCKDCANWATEWITSSGDGYHYCPMLDLETNEAFYCAESSERKEEI